MDGLGINLDAYQNLSGESAFHGNANTSMEALNELSKAMSTGNATGQSTVNQSVAGDAAPLRYESLDGVLKNVTFTEKQLSFWRRIPQTPAYSTVEEYNQLTSVGAERGGFLQEGETPSNEDSTYTRRAQLVKFIGTTRAVTHVATLTNNVVSNLIAREAKNGTLWVLRKLNKSLHSADSRLVEEEFNGIYAQHERPDGSNYQFGSKAQYFDSEVVIDLRGEPLTESVIEDAQEGIIENFGVGDEMLAAPKVFSDFAKSFYQQKRFFANDENQKAGMAGQRIVGHETEFGAVNFTSDIFMNKEKYILGTAATDSTKAPNAIVPDATDSVVAVGSDAAGKWASGDAGDYLYCVRPFNRYGHGPATVLDASATTIAAGGAVDLEFAAAGSGETATGFTIYRGQKGVTGAATRYYKVFDITASELTAGFDGAAAGLVRDRNYFMPDTNQAMLIENNDEIWTWRQLAPLMKMDLAITGPAYRFMVLLYGTPILFSQKKMTRFVNIGKA